MSSATTPSTLSDRWARWREPGVLYYLVVCLAALVLIYLVLDARGVDSDWTLAIVLVGILGIATCWGKAPIVFLLVVGVCVTSDASRALLSTQRGIRLADLLLCPSVLAYVLGHYRLQSLVKVIIPTVERKKPKSKRAGPSAEPAPLDVFPPGAIRPHRSATLVSRDEIGEFTIVLLGWAVAAQVVSWLLPTELGNPGVRPDFIWRAMALAWILAAFLVIANNVIEFRGRRRMRPDEAALFLQDQLWQETRGEQRKIARWMAWHRLGRPLGAISLLVDVMITVVLLLFAAVLGMVILGLFQALS